MVTLTSVVKSKGGPRRVPWRAVSTEPARMTVSHPSSHLTIAGITWDVLVFLEGQAPELPQKFLDQGGKPRTRPKPESEKTPLLEILLQRSPGGLEWGFSTEVASVNVSVESCLWTRWVKIQIMSLSWKCVLSHNNFKHWEFEYMCHMCSIHKFFWKIMLSVDFLKILKFLKIWKIWNICAWWVHDQNFMTYFDKTRNLTKKKFSKLFDHQIWLYLH